MGSLGQPSPIREPLLSGCRADESIADLEHSSLPRLKPGDADADTELGFPTINDDDKSSGWPTLSEICQVCIAEDAHEFDWLYACWACVLFFPIQILRYTSEGALAAHRNCASRACLQCRWQST